MYDLCVARVTEERLYMCMVCLGRASIYACGVHVRGAPIYTCEMVTSPGPADRILTGRQKMCHRGALYMAVVYGSEERLGSTTKCSVNVQKEPL